MASGCRPAAASTRRMVNPGSLEQEGMATEGFLDGVLDFFGQKKQQAQADPAALERREAATVAMQKTLKSLRLKVIAGEGEDGSPLRREAPIAVLQQQANQGLAIFAATNERALLDVLLSMRISAKEFAERNLLVVPCLFSLESRTLLDMSDTFSKSKLLNQGGVALPAVGDDEARATWGEMFAGEFAEAESQGVQELAKAQGIALIVQSSGQVARRGVGRPEWSSVFADLGI